MIVFMRAGHSDARRAAMLQSRARISANQASTGAARAACSWPSCAAQRDSQESQLLLRAGSQ